MLIVNPIKYDVIKVGRYRETLYLIELADS